jgi:hypothetical protein
VTYALLIYRTAPVSVPIPELDERVALAAHRNLQTEAGAKGELWAVARLDDAPSARTVRRKGGTHQDTDGPFIETKEWLVGFYLVDAESMEKAVERARVLCTDESHAIEVRPVTWQWKP